MFEPRLIAALEQMVELLHPPVLQIVIELLDSLDPESDSQLAYVLVQKLPNPAFRRCVTELIEIWQNHSPTIPAQAIALALQTASHTHQTLQKRYEVQPVWTIPQVGGQWIRQTEQVILEIISQAQAELLLISFAVYRIPQVVQALIQALERQVKVTLIVELPDTQKIAFGIFQSLPLSLLERLEIFYWPLACRPQDSQGHYGSLHIKGVIRDRHHVLITSANLTDYALNLNLELGLMTQQPHLARKIYDQLEILIDHNILLPWTLTSSP